MVTRVPEVLKVTPKTWKKDGQDVTTYWVTLDDRTEDVPCYDDKAKDLKTREPLPDGWEVKTSKAGKPYLATPKPKGGKGFETAYRNTQAGQAYEQERMDRRTALMQAITYINGGYAPPGENEDVMMAWDHIAGGMYRWLRASAAGVIPSPAAVEKEDSGEFLGKELPESSNNVGGEPSDRTERALSKSPESTPPATSSGEPVDGKPESEGVRGDDAPSDKLDGPSNLDKLYAKYGNGPKVLKAARVFFDHDPPNALADLTEGQMEMLLLEVAKA